MKKILIVTFILISLMISACSDRNDMGEYGDQGEALNQTVADAGDQMEEVTYDKNGITATYPKIIAGGTKEQISSWNRIISSDFDKMLHIYSFNPVPGPTPSPNAQVPSILNIQYEMKLLNETVISILYKAYYNTTFSAYPTELVYTTNILKEDSRRFKLTDVVDVNQDFVKNFRTWDFISSEEGNEEWDQAIKDYLANISNEDLLQGLQSADQIGSKNLWGINSYYTQDKLGISLGVPNYIGDHVEFERDYSKLKEFLKADVKIIP